MSYIKPFQSVELFENTFKHQINRSTSKVETRKYIFDRQFGNGPDELPVEADKYRLIWMPGCPHSNKAVITLRLLGLDKVISIGECGVLRDPRGWVFDEDLGGVDPVLKIHYLDDAYLKADQDFVGRSTVPAVIDIDSGKLVQNQPWELPTYLIRDWKKFHKENAPDLYPEALKEKIDNDIERIKLVNAYACGFARNQDIFDEGYREYFEALEYFEGILADKRFLNGDYISLSDIHLYVALIRFHLNYHLIFGVNKKRLQDYPNLWAYTKDLYQTEGFYEYTKIDLIKKHYQLSPHMRAKLGNVYGLVGPGPDNRELLIPSGRERLSKDPDNKFQYVQENRIIFSHNNVEDELCYLKEYVIGPIENAGQAKYQSELERWTNTLKDAFAEIDKRLKTRKYLLGNEISQADKLLYQTLLRFDAIYYYTYKLNFAKSYDYLNISRYLSDLSYIDDVKNSIDIEKEKEESFLALDDDRNPYHLIFRGPEHSYTERERC